MATIYFTQCDTAFVDPDMLSDEELYSPIIPRIEYYKNLLTQFPSGDFYTIDEHFILIAQWMKRRGTLANLKLVSVCGCPTNQCRKIEIETDDEGNMLDDPHHGFFCQRLDYLR